MAVQHQTGQRDSKSLTCLGQRLHSTYCTESINKLHHLREEGPDFIKGGWMDVKVLTLPFTKKQNKTHNCPEMIFGCFDTSVQIPFPDLSLSLGSSSSLKITTRKQIPRLLRTMMMMGDVVIVSTKALKYSGQP